VLVFRLKPHGAVVQDAADSAPANIDSPQELPLEARNVEGYAMARPEEPPIAARREGELVGRYGDWLSARGERAVRHRIPIPGGNLYTDLFNASTSELVEAKGSAARPYIRSGLGQILDYGRFIDHRSKALLLPTKPSADLIDLLDNHGVNVIWPTVDGFVRVD
jgi:hypothetical protein